jgi:hypothetical protein
VSTETYILGVLPNGLVRIRTENDGQSFLTGGAQARDDVVTVDQLRKRHPDLVTKYERMVRQAAKEKSNSRR